MASVALLLLLAAAPTLAAHGLLDLSRRGLTTMDVHHVPPDATSLTVNLSHNAISSWAGRPFMDLRNVTVLDLSHNHLRNVDAIALADVLDVRELDLSNNALTSLSGRPFRALLSLIHLDLSKNSLGTLKGSSLGDLARLLRLNLRGNKLVALADADFRGLAKLQWLDVSDNAIASAAAGAFRGLNGLDELVADFNANLGSLVIVGRRLQKVSLRRSGLTAVPASLTRSVRTLILTENRLKGIRCGDLDSYPLLRELDLSQNDIETIEDDALGRLEQLVVLRLSFNPKLRVVPPGLPSGLTNLELVGNSIESVGSTDFQGLRHLRTLNLSGNALRELSAGAFRPLEALESLDLSSNDLEALHADALEGLSRLQVLRLNGLRHLVRPASWLPFPVAPERLTVLDVSNSPVLAAQLLADTAALTAMRQLSELRMENDGLVTLRPDLPSLVGRLRKFRLRDNLLNCSDSALSWFFSSALDVDDARCASPDSLRGQALSSLRRMPRITLKDSAELDSTSSAPSLMTTTHLDTQQVLHLTTLVAGNITTPILVRMSSTHDATSLPLLNSNLTTQKPVIRSIHTREKAKQSAPVGDKPINEAQSTSSLTSKRIPDKSFEPPQQGSQKTTTVASPSSTTVSLVPSSTISSSVALSTKVSSSIPSSNKSSTSSTIALSTTLSPTVPPSKMSTVASSTSVSSSIPSSKPSTTEAPSTTVSPTVPPAPPTTEPPSTVAPSTTVSSSIHSSKTSTSSTVAPSTTVSPTVPPSKLAPPTTVPPSTVAPLTTVPPSTVAPSTTVSSSSMLSSKTSTSSTVAPSRTVSPTVQPSTVAPSTTSPVSPSTGAFPRLSPKTLPSSTVLHSNNVRTGAVTSIPPSVTQTSHISETPSTRLPPSSREALRAERPYSRISSVLAMFGVGVVGSALVLLVLAAAQAAQGPRLELSSFNTLRNEVDTDESRVELW